MPNRHIQDHAHSSAVQINASNPTCTKHSAEIQKNLFLSDSLRNQTGQGDVPWHTSVSFFPPDSQHGGGDPWFSEVSCIATNGEAIVLLRLPSTNQLWSNIHWFQTPPARLELPKFQGPPLLEFCNFRKYHKDKPLCVFHSKGHTLAWRM